mgnify:CR=1 FL=1
MKKVLTIGGATQDIYLHYEGADFMSITKKNSTTHYMLFESGEKIEVENLLYHTGGGATNSAVSFKKMGFENVMDCGDNTGVLRIDKKLEKELKAADVIISKGQANFESLPELWNGVYYLFKVKCRPMSEYLSIPIGSDMVMKI